MKYTFTAIMLAACLVLMAVPAEAKANHYRTTTNHSAIDAGGWGWGAGSAPSARYTHATTHFAARESFGTQWNDGGSRYGRSRHRTVPTNLPQDCLIALSKGGPCGCWAALHFGLPWTYASHVYRGINLWKAGAWYAFSHVQPAPETAAIFGSHHVAPVIAVGRDERGRVTVTIEDSWRTYTRLAAGLTFVKPS